MPIVQHRRGTLAALTAANETPSAGEIYLETDSNRLKVGDGVTSYTSLPYLVGSGASGGSSALNKSLTALTFNGSTTAFALAIGGVSVSPATAQSLSIELNGVIQIPDVAYTVSGSTITFSVAPAATDVFSGVYLSGGGAVFSAATITAAATDNYQLPLGATHVLLTSTVSKTFSSFVAEVGAEKWLYNASTVASGAIITLTHSATTGVAANRLATETEAAVIVQPNHSVLIAYDSTISRWRVSRAAISVNEAWWAAHADKTKLTGIATGATANSTDAQLRDRSTHTGAQATSTITSLDSTVTALTASIATKQVSGSYAASVHTHAIADVTSLQASLDAKQATGSYAASSHTHAIANVTGLQAAIDGKQATGSYAASVHTHAIADVTALQAALDGKQVTGVYATLVAGKVPSNQLPSYVDDVLEYDTFAQLPASGEESKIYLVISTSRIYRWAGTVYVLVEASPGSTDSVVEGATNLYFTNARAVTALAASLALKANLASPTFTGTVYGLTAGMVGLNAVSNTSDASKPVSTAAQTALNLKANLASPTFTGTVGGVTKAMVGLTNVSDTSDASKPVSTATQTALDLKADSSHTHTASAITDFATAVAAAKAPIVIAVGTGSGEMATNLSLGGDVYDMTFNGNGTIGNPTGTPVNGQEILWRITRTAAETVALGSDFKVISGTVSNTSQYRTFVRATYWTAETKWLSVISNADFTPPGGTVSILLHMDGADASTVFTDSSANALTVTANNGTTISTSQSKFGGASAYFTGNPVSYLTTEDSALFGFGTGDFTIEMWVQLVAGSGRFGALSIGDYTNGILWRMVPIGGQLFFAGTALNWFTANPAGVPIDGAWHHVAVTRQGTMARGFLDGGLDFETDVGVIDLGASRVLMIGCGSHELNDFEAFSGYIDNVKITKGEAIYTAAFTPSTASLLLHMDASPFVDSSPIGRVITVNGGVTLGAPKYGAGSCAFDGGSSCLSVTMDDMDWAIDWTIEFWMNPTVTDGNATPIAIGSLGPGVGGIHLSLVSNTFMWSDGLSAFLAGGAVVPGVWTHVAMVRLSGINYFYQDGVLIASGERIFPVVDLVVTIGSAPNYGFGFVGTLDEVRIVKGLAVYTGNFSPPAAPLT